MRVVFFIPLPDYFVKIHYLYYVKRIIFIVYIILCCQSIVSGYKSGTFCEIQSPVSYTEKYSDNKFSDFESDEDCNEFLCLQLQKDLTVPQFAEILIIDKINHSPFFISKIFKPPNKKYKLI